jgi:enoyl-CoA hydratase/carnithine racemase
MDYPEYEAIELSFDGPVATLALNKPDEMNTWSAPIAREVTTALARLDADDSVRVIILTGNGRAFCAGAGLARDGSTFGGGGVPINWEDRYPGPAKDADELVTPVIAAVNGAAVGYGATLAASCDIMIIAEDAKFGFVFNRRGIIPDRDLLWSLPRQIGYARAIDALLTARVFSGREVADMGLASRSVPRDQVLSVAHEVARDIAENVAPVSAAVTKLLARELLGETDATRAGERVHQFFAQLGQMSDAREGVLAFMEKRPANWQLSKNADLPEGLRPRDE